MLNNVISKLIATAALSLCCVGAFAADTGVAGDMPALKNLSQPDPGHYASGAVSPADVEALSKAGIRNVINLRPTSETPDFDEGSAVRAAGMNYESLPIASADDLNRANVERFDALLKKQQGQPSLVHCASSNRVGAMMALRAGWIQGQSTDQAIAVGKQWGLASLEPVVRKKLDSTTN